jgi:transcriptional regulator with XRE-family HTH domain
MKAKVRATPKERLPDLARKGLTQAEAARELGVSRQRVGQLVAELGLNFRPCYPNVSKAQLEALAKKRLTQTEAARKLGVSQKRVSKLAAEFDLSFATVWSRPRPATTRFGKVFQAARLAAGCSYGRLGALTGLHREHIKAIERGLVRRPREKTLRALASCLEGHVTFDQLADAAWAGRPPITGERLEVLSEKGLTQKEAAKELGVSQKHVSKLASRYGVSFRKAWRKPKPAATKFGKVLQKARLAAGHSYSGLGAVAGLHRRHVIDLERGRVRHPREKTLRALAGCLGAHVSYKELARAAEETAAARRRRPRGKRRQRRARGSRR